MLIVIFINMYSLMFIYIFDTRLQGIGPMIKRASLQKDYEKNKAFHGRRKKFVPFGVATSSSRKKSLGNVQSIDESHNDNDEDDVYEDIDPESDSFLSQYRSMNNISGGAYGSEEGGNGNTWTNPSPGMPQSISEFRRQVISKKKLENSSSNLVTTKKLAPINTDNSYSGNNETKSKYILTHDPESY